MKSGLGFLSSPEQPGALKSNARSSATKETIELLTNGPGLICVFPNWGVVARSISCKYEVSRGSTWPYSVLFAMLRNISAISVACSAIVATRGCSSTRLRPSPGCETFERVVKFPLCVGFVQNPAPLCEKLDVSPQPRCNNGDAGGEGQSVSRFRDVCGAHRDDAPKLVGVLNSREP